MRNEGLTGAIALVSIPNRGLDMPSHEIIDAVALLERAFDAEVVDRCADERCEVCAGVLDRAA